MAVDHKEWAKELGWKLVEFIATCLIPTHAHSTNTIESTQSTDAPPS
jgi:hypothetical protein